MLNSHFKLSQMLNSFFFLKSYFLCQLTIFLLQDTHNQVGIVQSGGIVPLLSLLDSKGGPLQHNSAFALYGLAENEVNDTGLP